MKSTERLIFTKPVQEDFNRFYEINADPHTNLFNPAGAMNFETAERDFKKMLTHWTENAFGTWAIKEKEDAAIIIGFGGLTYRLYAHEVKLNVGYRFAKNYWGKGYATELTKAAIQYAFNGLNKNEVFAVVRPMHLVSIKVLEKCNMQLFGGLNDVENEAHSLVYKIEK